MAAYTMKSDTLFLRCFDMDAIQVYELDSPYIFPVKEKHWSHVEISIGPGKEYEALKVGDKEISGHDLQVLIEDLFNSRLIVNREGLCFLATTGVTTQVLGVDKDKYYRLFDLFDWSKYHVKTLIDTRWARRDIIDGRPLIDILGSNSRDDIHNNEYEEKSNEEELIKAKQQHIDKLKEELKENSKKNQEYIAELKRKHEEDLKELKSKMEEEFETKQEELKIFAFKRSGLNAHDYYHRMVQSVHLTVPYSKFNACQAGSQRPRHWPPSSYPEIVTPLGAVETISEKRIAFDSAYIHMDFDYNNWRTLKVALSGWFKNHGSNFTTQIYDVWYYDGNKYQVMAYNGKERISSPCRIDYISKVSYIKVRYILGVGFKFTI